MSDTATSDEVESTIPQHSREDVPMSEGPTRTFTIEIRPDVVDILESIIEDVRYFFYFLFEIPIEILQSLHFLAIEDQRILLKFSTRILIINSIVCNLLSPLIEAQVTVKSESESSTLLSPRLSIKVMDILNTTLDGLAGDFTSGERRIQDDAIDSMGSERLAFVSPSTIMIVGSLIVILMTYIIADNKYYVFATLFAPMVDNVLSTTRSLFTFPTPNHSNRRIPENDEIYDGVLWGMVALFFLESLLVGSILVLMVLISLALTIFATLSSAPKVSIEIVEEMPTVFIGVLLLWVGGVLMANILRMVIYQTADDDD